MNGSQRKQTTSPRSNASRPRPVLTKNNDDGKNIICLPFRDRVTPSNHRDRSLKLTPTASAPSRNPGVTQNRKFQCTHPRFASAALRAQQHIPPSSTSLPTARLVMSQPAHLTSRDGRRSPTIPLLFFFLFFRRTGWAGDERSKTFQGEHRIWPQYSTCKKAEQATPLKIRSICFTSHQTLASKTSAVFCTGETAPC